MKLSLCIPTYGVIEWIFPVLNSIYSQGVDEETFEVIVTDNGDNKSFEEQMTQYKKEHSNIIYFKNNSYLFDNQLESLKLATGDYLKFVNHRSVWLEGRLQFMIDFLSDYETEKPVIYFSNGMMGWGPEFKEFSTFDDFVRNLGVYSTWTSGVGIWREDYEKISKPIRYDQISPHSSILFSERKKRKYIIHDKYWMKDIIEDHSKKGKYDLYKAFALDEFIITINLYRDGDISAETLKLVKESFAEFLSEQYCVFNIMDTPCSYNIDNFDKYIDIFFDGKLIISMAKEKYLLMKENGYE